MSTPGLLPNAQPQVPPTPTDTNPMAQLTAMLQRIKMLSPQAASQAQGQGGAQPGLTPPPAPQQAQPTYSPTMMPPATPKQVGGPGAQPSHFGGLVGQIINAVHGHEQQKFDKEAEEASTVVTAQMIQGRIKDENYSPNQQEMMVLKQANALEKKAPKLMKDMTTKLDSPAYAGFVRAQQAEEQRKQTIVAQKQAADKLQADIDAKNAAAKRADMLEQIVALTAQRNLTTVQNQGAKISDQHTDEQNKLVSKNYLSGLNTTFDDQGKATIVPFTKEQVANDPVLKMKSDLIESQVSKNMSTGKASLLNATSNRMKAEAAVQDSQTFKSGGGLQGWSKLLSDPKSGVTLASVPSRFRNSVVNYMTSNGIGIQKPLTNDEIKRSDLAGNASLNLKKAQDILTNHPELFGPGGWGHTKYEMAIAGGDPNALAFQAAITLANLPAVGVHGVRGKWALEDLQKLDGNLYENPDAMKNVLDTVSGSVNEFRDAGGRNLGSGTPTSQGGGSSTPTGGGDPFAQFGGKAVK